jgi:HPt (histidine-containing phosphotransfer) domain-containing protein
MQTKAELDLKKLAVFREIPGSDGRPLLHELVPVFSKESARTLVEMQEAWSLQDSAKFRMLVHRLKGSASNFGAEPLTAMALSLELEAREGRLPEQEALEDLKRIFELTTAMLERELV